MWSKTDVPGTAMSRSQATNTSATTNCPDIVYHLLPYNMASETLIIQSNSKWPHCHLLYCSWSATVGGICRPLICESPICVGLQGLWLVLMQFNTDLWWVRSLKTRPSLVKIVWPQKLITGFAFSCLEKIPGLFRDFSGPPKRFLYRTLHTYGTCATEPIVPSVIHGQHAWPNALYAKMQYPHKHYIWNAKYFEIYCQPQLNSRTFQETTL